ncbi:hypothetical protein ACFYUV_31430 [Nonomuraea sp. NPDC003560]|uniref:hypothetical protein n=1 Tax=Nonomuraea sp. NPDC003560 TaxID=3364341 RepID=UPI0036A9AFE3
MCTPALRTGDNIVAYDVEILPPWRVPGRPTTDRWLTVRDLYVDIVVPPAGPRYEVLDLDELADALRDGVIDAATTVRVLRDTQRFIDRHLRNLNQEPPNSWPDFPPAAVLDLTGLPPFDVTRG